jgi:phosphomannomutase
MLAAMHFLAEAGASGEPVSVLAAKFSPYFQSGEINSQVENVPAAIEELRKTFAGRGVFDELDGLTVSSGEIEKDLNPPTPGEVRDFWWFNVRPSNTEPLLRLNVEAGSPEKMTEIRDEALRVIRGD